MKRFSVRHQIGIAGLGLSLLVLVLASSTALAAAPRPKPKSPASCINQFGGKCKSTPNPKACYLNGRPIACSPSAPTGWTIAKSKHDTGPLSAITIDVTIDNPNALEARFIGTMTSDGATADGFCGDGAVWHRDYRKAGTYALPTTTGTDSCSLSLLMFGKDAITVQLLERTGAGGGTTTTTTPTTTSPTPTPNPSGNHDGTWVGDLTGVVSWTTQPTTTTENLDFPISGSVTDGTLNLDNNFDASGDSFSVADASDNYPEIPDNGLVTLWATLDILPPESLNVSETFMGGTDGSCVFLMQFRTDGTATSVAKDGSTGDPTIVCTGASEHGTAATFVGKLTLKRTS